MERRVRPRPRRTPVPRYPGESGGPGVLRAPGGDQAAVRGTIPCWSATTSATGADLFMADQIVSRSGSSTKLRRRARQLGLQMKRNFHRLRCDPAPMSAPNLILLTL